MCSICSKHCKTISAMRMHEYEHGDIHDCNKCVDCGKGFPFASQLKTHRKSHLTALEHQCGKCNKWFKNNGEADKHQAVHSGKVWSCTKCDYRCNNPRNLKAHQFKHNDTNRYTCDKCKKSFKYYMQYKRHKNNPECK